MPREARDLGGVLLVATGLIVSLFLVGLVIPDRWSFDVTLSEAALDLRADRVDDVMRAMTHLGGTRFVLLALAIGLAGVTAWKRDHHWVAFFALCSFAPVLWSPLPKAQANAAAKVAAATACPLGNAKPPISTSGSN